MMSLISLTIWMILQGVIEGIFFDMRDHRKEYPLNIHYLFGAIRVVVWLIDPALVNGLWLVLAYPFFHDGAMYVSRYWSWRNRKGLKLCWLGFTEAWTQNPPNQPYKGKSIFSFRWEWRVIFLIASVAVIGFLHFKDGFSHF